MTVNSFARCRHLFDRAAKPTDFDSIRIFSRILLPCSCSNFAQNVIIYLFVVMTSSREFHRNSFSILARRKKYIRHGTENGTDRRRDGQGKNIMPPAQHKLRRHKNKVNASSRDTWREYTWDSVRNNHILFEITDHLPISIRFLWDSDKCLKPVSLSTFLF